MSAQAGFSLTKRALLSASLVGASVVFAHAGELTATSAAALAPPAPSPFASIWKFRPQRHNVFPQGGVALDLNGNIYGTGVAFLPCSTACGELFSLSKSAGGGLTYETIHTFAAREGVPFASLTSDGNTIYGVTATDGAKDGVAGMVFQLTGSPGNWTFKILHQFDPTGISGFGPLSGVTVGPEGTLYGAAAGGQGTKPPCDGVIYKITKPRTYAILHDFSNETGDVSGGCNPRGELVFGRDGALYGTTESGGTSNLPNGNGTVFRLALNGQFSVIHNFVDGGGPAQRIAVDARGTLYGTTQTGGPNNHGTAWTLQPQGRNWNFTEIYDFPQGGGAVHGIVRDRAGNLYGTIGSSNNESANFREGALYSLSPPASGSTWDFTLLHSFSLVDGASPETGPTLVGRDLYGPTFAGGRLVKRCANFQGCGTVYRYRLQ